VPYRALLCLLFQSCNTADQINLVCNRTRTSGLQLPCRLQIEFVVGTVFSLTRSYVRGSSRRLYPYLVARLIIRKLVLVLEHVRFTLENIRSSLGELPHTILCVLIGHDDLCHFAATTA
jgi:hypothetical protein